MRGLSPVERSAIIRFDFFPYSLLKILLFILSSFSSPSPLLPYKHKLRDRFKSAPTKRENNGHHLPWREGRNRSARIQFTGSPKWQALQDTESVAPPLCVACRPDDYDLLLKLDETNRRKVVAGDVLDNFATVVRWKERAPGSRGPRKTMFRELGSFR